MPEEIEGYNPPTSSEEPTKSRRVVGGSESQPSARPLKDYNPLATQKEEKLEFLKREEIRTMAKDLSRLREAEAQKERERIAALQLEKIKKAAEGEPRQGREEKIIPHGTPEKPLEEKPAKEVLISKPLLKRPSSFQKVLARGVVVFFCLLLISGLFIGL